MLKNKLSVATSSARLEDLACLDEEQRHIPSRTSLRMPRQNSGSRSQPEHRGKCTLVNVSKTSIKGCKRANNISLSPYSFFYSLSQPEASAL